MRRLLRWARLRPEGPLAIPPWVRVGLQSRVFADRFHRRGTSGSVAVGASSDVACSIYLERDGATVEIGDRTHVGANTLFTCASQVRIGNDVLVAFDVLFSDHNSHSLDYEHRQNDVVEWMHGRKEWAHVGVAPIHVEDKAWIGARAIILKGVRVGEGAVVAAGTVVTRDVPAWTLVAGNPARVVRQLPVRNTPGAGVS